MDRAFDVLSAATGCRSPPPRYESVRRWSAFRQRLSNRRRPLRLLGELGLDRAAHGTHSIRRTKATLIYRRTKNLRAVQLLLGHTKLVSTVRYLGIEVDDALEIAGQTEV